MLAAVALGSNLSSAFGDPAANLHEALRRLRSFGAVTAVSSFRSTAPVGYTAQPDFVNAACLLETGRDPLDLLHRLLSTERDMGRDRRASPPKGPRIIDLDLLLYIGAGGSLVLHDPELILPHPAMHERRFVLEPLAEIAPELVHPVLQRSMADLLGALLARPSGVVT